MFPLDLEEREITLFEKQWMNLYLGSLYTHFYINDDTAIDASLAARSVQENGISSTETEIRIGVKRSL